MITIVDDSRPACSTMAKLMHNGTRYCIVNASNG